MEDNVINRLVPRLRKIGIEVELFGNVPWIYLDKVNGNKVKEKFHANHGFTIAFYPIKIGEQIELTDIREIFKTIRKYRWKILNYLEDDNHL